MSKLVRHTAPRDIPNNFILNENSSMFSFIIPEYGENLYYRGVDDWCFIGTTPGYLYLNDEPLFHPQHGYIQPTEGQFMYNNIYETLEPNKPYTFSFWVKRAPGSFPSEINVFIGSSFTQIPQTFNLEYGFKTIHANDYWCAYSITFYTNNYNPNKDYYFVFEFPEGGEFFMDGFQLEQKPYRTTYINGDLAYLKNKSNYYWAGEQNNSISIREGAVDAGRIISFNDIGFNLIEAEGFGLPDFEHSTVELPANPIALHQNSIPQQRDVSLNFNIYSKDLPDLLNKRKQLIKQLKTGQLHFQIQIFNCADPISNVFETTLLYDGGAELNLDSFYGEQLSLDFTTYDPYLYRVGIGAAILAPVTSGNVNIAIKRNGVWGDMTPPKNADISKILIASNSTIYVLYRIPAFEDAFLYKYNIKSQTWQPLLWSGDINQVFYDMLIIGNELYICGKFNRILAPGQVITISGPYVNLAKYNINTQILNNILQSSTGIGGGAPFIYGMTLLDNNRLLLYGQFATLTGIQGTIHTKHICIMNINSEILFGVSTTAINDGGIVYTAINTGQNSILLGGKFTMGGYNNLVQINNINQPNQSSRILFSAGEPNNTVYTMTKADDGTIYIGGNFTNAITGQGVATQTVGNYNSGATPVSIGKLTFPYNTIQGLPNGSVLHRDNNTVGTVHELTIDNNNIMYINGYFDYYGPLIMNGFNGSDGDNLLTIVSNGDFDINCTSYAKYNIVTQEWEPPTILYGNNYPIYDILVTDAELFKLYGIDVIIPRAGQYKANNEVILELPSDASPTYPSVNIIGPLFSEDLHVNGLHNITYGTQLYFSRVLGQLEKYTIELRGLLPKVTSAIYGELNGQLLYGSNPKTFILYPGVNQLRLDLALNDISGSDSPTLVIVYDKRYLSIDSIVESSDYEY